jgi:hypothetical protein
MPKKKTRTSPITTAEAFYIESHWGKKEPAAIAADIGREAKTVEAYLAKLAADGRQPAPKPAPKSGPERAGFAVHNGVTSMTQAASERGDDTIGNSPFTNPEVKAAVQEQNRKDAEEFSGKRLRNAVHVMNPNRR